jgi:hypothetical protein
MDRVTVSRTLRAVAAAIALVLLAACSASVSVGTGKKLDTDKAEASIRKMFGSTPVEAVTCPKRDVKEGDVFECTARVDGQPVRVKVTQNDDQGNVSLDRVDAILDLSQATAFVEGQVLTATGSAVKADCGPGQYLVKEPGEEVECAITPASGGAGGRAILTVDDVDGNVTMRVV